MAKIFEKTLFWGYEPVAVDQHVQSLQQQIDSLKHEVKSLQLDLRSKEKNSLLDLLENVRTARAQLSVLQDLASKDFHTFLEQQRSESVLLLLQSLPVEQQAVALSIMGRHGKKAFKQMTTAQKLPILQNLAQERIITKENEEEVIRAFWENFGSFQKHNDRKKIGGVDSVVYLLKSVPSRRRLLAEIEAADEQLGEQVRESIVHFEELIHLDNLAIQCVLKQVERNDLVLALKGASAALEELFLNNISRRAAEDLREEMEIMGGSLPAETIQRAQDTIADTAHRLRADGAIYWERPHESRRAASSIVSDDSGDADPKSALRSSEHSPSVSSRSERP